MRKTICKESIEIHLWLPIESLEVIVIPDEEMGYCLNERVV